MSEGIPLRLVIERAAGPFLITFLFQLLISTVLVLFSHQIQAGRADIELHSYDAENST